jgi:polyisoprenoid-binding protein YceI
MNAGGWSLTIFITWISELASWPSGSAHRMAGWGGFKDAETGKLKRAFLHRLSEGGPMGAPTSHPNRLRHFFASLGVLICIVCGVAACAPVTPASSQAADPSPAPRGSVSPAIPGLPPGMRVEFVTPTPDFSTPPPDAIKLVIQQPSQARYRANEMLVGRISMSEAIGTTDAVSGQIFVWPDGRIIPGGSSITVGLAGLKSDEDRRDSFIKENTLETNRFPEATFVPTSAEGIPEKATESGQITFRLQGNLTVKGVTKVTTWIVSAEVSPDSVVGNASTNIKFEDFGMEPPKVPLVVGIDDTLRLEINFTAAREQA